MTNLDAPKSQIMACAKLRNNFDACTTLYKDFVAQCNMNAFSSFFCCNPTLFIPDGKGGLFAKAKEKDLNLTSIIPFNSVHTISSRQNAF